MERIKKLSLLFLGIWLFYGLLVYVHFQFETFSPTQEDISLTGALVYTILNPTGLGNTGSNMTFPETTGGVATSFVFVLTGLGLLGVFIGKMSDLFTEFREHRHLGYTGTDFRDHVIVLGWSSFTRQVVDELVKSGIGVAVVTDEKSDIDQIYESFDRKEVFALFSELNNYGLLEKVNVKRSFRVLVSLASDTATLVTLLNLRRRYPDRTYVASVRNEELIDTFLEAGARYAVSRYDDAARLVSSNIYEPDMAQLTGDMIASTTGEDEFELQQFLVTGENDLAGRPYGDVFRALVEDHDVISLGLSKPREGDGSRRELFKLPADEVPVEAGDYLILFVNERTARAIGDRFGVRQGVRASRPVTG